MNVSDLVVSYIRTLVPVAVGVGLSWLAKTLGVIVPAEEAVPYVVAACISAYYVLVRFLESRYPALGWLLGAPRTPEYASPAAK